MKRELTVIIPFLNEGKEIHNTLESIRQTAGDEVQIILINDASTDGIDYASVAQTFGCKYMQNSERQGVACSRDTGVVHAETGYVLLLDGHMRCYTNHWHTDILSAIEQDEEAIYCCTCRQTDGVNFSNDANNYGAYLSFWGDTYDTILEPKWISRSFMQGFSEDIVEIPCILGASYAFAKDYWQKLQGLAGLRYYGSDEAYISLKSWMSGGSCKLIKPVEIGHIFRNTAPYPTKFSDISYNKLLIAELLFDEKNKKRTFELLKNVLPEQYNKSLFLLEMQEDETAELKAALKPVLKYDLTYFQEQINQRFEKK
jgi:glycosyltransferase involved in cell wall biosynthesis